MTLGGFEYVLREDDDNARPDVISKHASDERKHKPPAF